MHPWVNLQSMLEKCLVGNLVQSQSSDETSLNDATSDLSVKTDNKKSIKLTKNVSLEKETKPILSKEIPVLDSYQTAESVSIVLYTKCKNLKDNCLTVDKSDEKNTNNIILFLYTLNGVYKYALG